ncbi:hypothetical protein IFM89_039567 [Coptis chinensis]|uniref:Uncharacterized protein n=1 Tax=Coptis chinensis TaxID=261450 RepID=A0A835GWF4_9MAGN|nr:hypothetical protein IFM89_039567 [Coptis chinensis]
MKRGGGWKIAGPHGNAKVEKKDRDEDLLLFRDMQKRDKDRIVSLLNPIPLDDLESNSGMQLSIVQNPICKKFGFEFLNESDKNDYDWLKTPPATPLFASLEMDAGGPDLVVQRELPILTHLSRFSGNSQEAPKMIPRSKSPNPMAKVLPRSFAQNIRPNVPPSWTDATSKKGPWVSNLITNERSNTLVTTTEHTKPTEHPFSTQKSTKRYLSSDLSPHKLTVVSSESLNETPPNLITNRSTSTSRGGPSNPSIASSAGQPTDHLSSGVPSTNRSSSTSKGRPSNPSISSTPRQPIEHPSSVVPFTNRSSSTSKGRPSNPRQPTDQRYNHVLSNTTKALEKDLAQSISPPKL